MGNEPLHGMVKCIRCDEEIAGDPAKNFTITWGHEAGSAYVCSDCESTIKERNVWTND
jgi:NAD-dependent SIR2 family protein deacetylase